MKPLTMPLAVVGILLLVRGDAYRWWELSVCFAVTVAVDGVLWHRSQKEGRRDR